MKKIYLYLKTHNITGLKYLGKTEQCDPHLYTGSGKRWKAHLKKHGYDVTTQILLETTDHNEIKRWGEYYSALWNIVNNLEFANLRSESGDGGDTSQCAAYLQGIARRNLSGSNNPMFGRSAITENNIRWYNNGKENVYVAEGTQPTNFVPGRIIGYKKPHTVESKRKMSLANQKHRPCQSPNNLKFSSVHEASATTGMTVAAIRESIKRGKSGWKYL
jgi:hypothetical protein